jgi:O-antigen/teichoic acid export membrane protein
MPRGSRRLINDLGAGTATTVFLAVVVFVSTIALVRILSVEQFGRISLILLLFNLASVFDAVRPVTIYFANRFVEERGSVLNTVLLLDIGIGSMLAAVVAAFSVFFPLAVLSRVDLLCLAIGFFFFFLQSAYWGWADAHGLVARTVIMRSILLAGLYAAYVLLAFTGADDVWYGLVLVVVSASGLFSFWFLCHKHRLLTRISVPDMKLARRIGREVTRYVQFNIATLVLATSDRFAITNYLWERSLGLYSGCFELATKPMAFARSAQTVLNPHLTRAAATGLDLFSLWARTTKIAFVLASIGAWLAAFLREILVPLVLGEPYGVAEDVFGIVVLAQPFVVLGYACALFLNAYGNFQLQRMFYSFAAVFMVLGAWLAASWSGIILVACVYATTRTVDLWLLLAAVKSTRRALKISLLVLVCSVWCFTTALAWIGSAWPMLGGIAVFSVLMLRLRLTSIRSKDDVA